MKRAFFCLLICMFVTVSAEKKTSVVTLNGQVASWAITQFDDPVVLQFGGRFVPTLLGNFAMSDKSTFDFEASLNIHGSANFFGLNYDKGIAKFKPYRVWARYAADNWEVRAGLQKLNFGSAKLFRPLMWFDAMDVRDPLQLTDGVYGVLGRYYFQNNANVWLWTLMGNEKRKGWETMGSAQWKPEVGGRLQIPAGPGELALSTHYRKANVQTFLPSGADKTLLNESRIGLDGKWDVGVGLWFESSVTVLEANTYKIPKVQDAWNVGADYTFPIGNGVGVTVEYFRYHVADQFLTSGTTLNLVGSMFTYPLSVLDNLSAMVFYLPKQRLWYNFLSWSRTYDNWSLYIIGFWNPTNYQLITSQSEGTNLFAGKGVQVMVSYNF